MSIICLVILVIDLGSFSEVDKEGDLGDVSIWWDIIGVEFSTFSHARILEVIVYWLLGCIGDIIDIFDDVMRL